mmetsp:Transcript_53705/g.125972  ORF Transcript_53705/g.125972 Transcript_53705/m.125972 type:complete len:204 (-) Transcript_53705:94-705(-)
MMSKAVKATKQIEAALLQATGRTNQAKGVPAIPGCCQEDGLPGLSLVLGLPHIIESATVRTAASAGDEHPFSAICDRAEVFPSRPRRFPGLQHPSFAIWAPPHIAFQKAHRWWDAAFIAAQEEELSATCAQQCMPMTRSKGSGVNEAAPITFLVSGPDIAEVLKVVPASNQKEIAIWSHCGTEVDPWRPAAIFAETCPWRGRE